MNRSDCRQLDFDESQKSVQMLHVLPVSVLVLRPPPTIQLCVSDAGRPRDPKEAESCDVRIKEM